MAIGYPGTTKIINFNCDYCGKPNSRKETEFKRYEKHYCNMTCNGNSKLSFIPPSVIGKKCKCGNILAESDLFLNESRRYTHKCKICRDEEYKKEHEDKLSKRSKFIKKWNSLLLVFVKEFTYF